MSIFSKVGHGISKGIGNVSGGIGGFLNDLLGSSDTMKQTYRYNQQSANADMQRSIALWNMQNQYNTPAAQIARLAAAGIDVNPMTYAVGSGNMNSTAGSISAPGMGSVSTGSAGNPVALVLDLISGIQDIKLKQEQVRAATAVNDENEDTGTTTETTYPVKVVKQIGRNIHDMGTKKVPELLSETPVEKAINYLVDVFDGTYFKSPEYLEYREELRRKGEGPFF